MQLTEINIAYYETNQPQGSGIQELTLPPKKSLNLYIRSELTFLFCKILELSTMRFITSSVVKLLNAVSFVMAANVLYSIPEHSKSGTLIGSIPESISLIKLVSQASFPYMKYSFLSIDSNVKKYFALNDKTGDLRLSSTEILDREVVCQFDLTCIIDLQIAIQSTHTQFFRKVLISIDVVDINDHSPHFKENLTVLTISESIHIPTSYPLPPATDKDTGGNNSLQGYEIFPKDTPFELSYSKGNSNLMLRLVKELDHETRDFYSLRIIAHDGGNPPREGVLNVDITVEDVNDNAPKFTQENYAKVVDETVSQGSLLFTLTATDADSGKNGQVRYRLSPQQPASVLSMFTVDEMLGDLRLVGDFQNADTELYKVDVEASDMADQPFTTKMTVSIQVEDTINSRPKLLISYLSTNNYSSISEYANVGVAVAHILVRDTDRGPNGIVQCKLNTQDYFELQSYDIKEYNVIVARPLDRESIQVHNVTVECSDAGIPPLSFSESFQVQVTDENDNTPEFTDRFYNITIRENNDIDKEVLRITAADRDDPVTGNGRITYSLQNVADGDFLINPDTGVIKAMTSFDYEVKREINFTVVAEDNGNPRRSAKAAISVNILDENDQVPYFTQSRFTIAVSEYARPGDLIGELKAFDFEQGQNGQFDISQIPGSGKGKKDKRSSFLDDSNPQDKFTNEYEQIDDKSFPFEVRPNGSMFLTNTIDHETRTSYEFQVRVTDKGEPPLSDTANVVIGVKDENDNAPHILHPNTSEMSFTALTGSDAPLTLLVLDVLDRDSGRNGFLVYTVTARNDSGRFEVDEEGKVKRTRELGSKDRGTYKLTVVVMDSGTPPLSDVRTFLIHVAGGNDTAGRAGALSDQYIVITLTLVCVTILLCVTVMLIIVIMKRLDSRRKNTGSCSPRGHTHSPRVISSFAEPPKMDTFKNERTDKQFNDNDNGNIDGNKKNDSQYGFSSSSGSVNKNNMGDSKYKVNNRNLPAAVSTEEDSDHGTLQLHPVLFTTFKDSQVVTTFPEDGASNSSGDTITSDSGRGTSDEDISISNMAAGESLAGQDTSLQSYNTACGQNVSPKSSVKQHIRSSQRKHVTFKDMKQSLNYTGGQSRSSESPSSHGNDVTSGTVRSLKLSEGSLQQQSVITFVGGNNGVGTPCRDKNNSISSDNNNVSAQHTKFNSFADNPHSKNSQVSISPTFNYGSKPDGDSPRLQTFQTTAAHHPSQSSRSTHLLVSAGKDPVPSTTASVSPCEWGSSIRYARQDSNDFNLPPQQAYSHRV